MRETEDDSLYGATDQAFVWNEIGKAFSLMAHDMAEEWEQWELSQLNDGGSLTRPADNFLTPVAEPVEGSDSLSSTLNLSLEPDPWDGDRPLEAGEEGDFRSGSEQTDRPLGGDGRNGAPDGSSTSTIATEPTKEQQPRLRLQGNIGRAPSFSITSRGTPRITFPLATHDEQEDGSKTTEWHSIYSTKNFALAINGQELQRGEEVRVIGVEHQSPKKDRQGKVLTKEGGEIVTEKQIYAYSVKRVGEGKNG